MEKIAKLVCQIQQTLTPKLVKPTIVVFAGDPGLVRQGVSAYPQEVTRQMVLNFLGGGAAINVFSNQHLIDLKIVDVGVNFGFGDHPGLIHAKVAMGTKNSLVENAMSSDQLNQAIQKGIDIINDIHAKGTNIIGFGEMGIGNTSAASLIMSHICQIPMKGCVGRGTGLGDTGRQKKINILQQLQARHVGISGTAELLQAVGGFEIAMMTGSMLQATSLAMIVLIYGFIATSDYLCAQSFHSNIQHYALFCHQSDEPVYKYMLDHLKS